MVVPIMKVHCCELQVRLIESRDPHSAQVDHEEVTAMAQAHGRSLDDDGAKGIPSMASKL